MTRDEYKKQMREEMEADVLKNNRDRSQILVRSQGRALTCDQMMDEVDSDTPLGVQLLDSYIKFEETGVMERSPLEDPDPVDAIQGLLQSLLNQFFPPPPPVVLEGVLEDDVRERARRLVLEALTAQEKYYHERALQYGGKIYNALELIDEVKQKSVLGEAAVDQFITYEKTGKFVRIVGETTDWIQFDDDNIKQLN
jgi:hypothetical protein